MLLQLSPTALRPFLCLTTTPNVYHTYELTSSVEAQSHYIVIDMLKLSTGELNSDKLTLHITKQYEL